MRNMTEEKLVGTAWRLAVVAACAIGVAACAPRKVVYIPQDWSTSPPPRAAAPSAPKPSGPLKEQPAPQPGEPILKGQPSFKESDLPAAPAAPSAPSPQKNAAEQPQYLASMHLVDQAKTALGQGKSDQAISLLEQAIQVDVYNGNAFFLLARAWRAKGARQKSLEFARKAEILFQEDRARLKEVYLFEADVYKDLKDTGKAEAYRQKASKL
ncbi:MAG: hypothetical protein LLF99_09345 [Desulfobacteraceae bacterium]|nr:hypothetical protein [Desulfobacteraceae bacterium]